MTLEQQLRLSYYREVADIDPEHGVRLVQDTRTRKFYVKKQLTVYNAGIYRSLQARPVANTPAIVLAEEDGQTLTVIEEYIPGDTLEELLDREGPLPREQVIDIACQLCGILAEFHSRTPAIVNRDIKPSNLKLSPDGVVKLLDLNAAKWSDGGDRDTVLLGTQGYAAPEQYGFGPSSVQTDIYAVGVLMHVLLTGRLPGREPLPGELGPIIRKCVELSPAARFRSVQELHSALTALSDRREEPVSRPDWRRFLPPGFRGGGIGTWLLSALGYAMLLYLSVSMEFEDMGPAQTKLNRLTFGAALFAIVAFNGNYLDCQKSFVLTRSPLRFLRWLGMAAVDLGLLMLAAIFSGILESLFLV